MNAPVRIVKLKDLVLEHKFFTNPRTETGLDKESIEGLADSMKKHDLKDALTVVRFKDSEDDEEIKTLILDGQRRSKAARSLKWDEIAVRDFTDDVVVMTKEKGIQLMLAMLRAGNERQPLSSPELVAAARLLRKQGATVQKIGDSIGKDASWVTRMLAADESIDESIKKDWENGKIPDEMFKELAAIKPAEQPLYYKEFRKLREENKPGDARQMIKEIAATQRAERAEADEKAGKKKPGRKPTKPAKAAPKADDRASRPSAAAVQELAGYAKHKIVDPYTQGVVACARYCLGEISVRDFAKSFHRAIASLDGTKKVTKSIEKQVKKAKKAEKASAESSKKEKVAKPKTEKAAKPKKTSNGHVVTEADPGLLTQAEAAAIAAEAGEVAAN